MTNAAPASKPFTPTKYQRTVLACLRTARDDRTFWTPFFDANERRAARDLAAKGYLILEDDRAERCTWAAPTRSGLVLLAQ